MLAPVVRGRKGEHQKLFDDIRKNGYVRVRVDGELREVTEPIALEKNRKHTIEVVVDRIVVRPDISSRLADSLETALALSGGLVVIDVISQEELLFSQNFACPNCGFSVGELAPRMFSFNSPFGACETCYGLGVQMEVDEDLVIPDKTATIADGGIVPWAGSTSTYYPQLLEAACKAFGVPVDVPIEEIPADLLRKVLYGNGEKIRFTFENEFGQVKTAEIPYEGVIPNLQRRHRRPRRIPSASSSKSSWRPKRAPVATDGD